MDTIGHKGGLAMPCSSECDVNIQSHSSNHNDSLIKLKEGQNFRFTSFYGHPKIEPKTTFMGAYKKHCPKGE